MTTAEIREFEKKLEALEDRARKNPGTLVRFCAGNYFVFVRGELVEITYNDELTGAAKWIAHEKTGKWYSDPFYTLSECKTNILGE